MNEFSEQPMESRDEEPMDAEDGYVKGHLAFRDDGLDNERRYRERCLDRAMDLHGLGSNGRRFGRQPYQVTGIEEHTERHTLVMTSAEEFWDFINGTRSPTEFFDDGTMDKVLAAIRKATKNRTNDEVRLNIITELQNAGILFRERA